VQIATVKKLTAKKLDFYPSSLHIIAIIWAPVTKAQVPNSEPNEGTISGTVLLRTSNRLQRKCGKARVAPGWNIPQRTDGPGGHFEVGAFRKHVRDCG